MSLIADGFGGAGAVVTDGLGGVIGSVQNQQSMFHFMIDQTRMCLLADDTCIQLIDQIDFFIKDES